MRNCKTAQKQRIFFVFVIVILCSFLLSARLVYLMVIKADHYAKKAKEVQQRERAIKAERGKIYDRNGILIAANKPVSTISVIHNQIKDKETVIEDIHFEMTVDYQCQPINRFSHIDIMIGNIDVFDFISIDDHLRAAIILSRS